MDAYRLEAEAALRSRADIDPDLGAQLLEEVADKMTPVFDHLAEYLAHLEANPRSFVG